MLGAVGQQRKVISPLGTPASRESLSLSHKTVLLSRGPLQGLLVMPPLQVSRPSLLPDQQATHKNPRTRLPQERTRFPLWAPSLGVARGTQDSSG